MPVDASIDAWIFTSGRARFTSDQRLKWLIDVCLIYFPLHNIQNDITGRPICDAPGA